MNELEKNPFPGCQKEAIIKPEIEKPLDFYYIFHLRRLRYQNLPRSTDS